MGSIFGWLSAPGDIAQEDWSRFLDSYADFFIFIVLLTIGVILFFYRFWALRLKIRNEADVFRAYAPMRAMWIVLIGAALAAIVAVMQYHSLLLTWAGMPGFAGLMFVLVAVICFLLSYVSIAFVPALTPPKFRYRPAPFLHKKTSTR